MYQSIIRKIEDLIPAFKAINTAFTGEPCVLTFQQVSEKRRDAQNRRYWAILHEIAEQIKVDTRTMSADTWAEWAKRRFIGVIEIPLPDGEVVVVGMSSTKLSVAEFSEYMLMIEVWAIDHGVIFNELPIETV